MALTDLLYLSIQLIKLNILKEGKYMNKVLNVRKYTATRDLTLENTLTGTIDKCFDDFLYTTKKDFFEEGKEYECKILLFGNQVNGTSNGGVKFKVVNTDVIVGSRHLVELALNNDIYYVSQSDLILPVSGEYIYFDYSRKDLIQVDDMIHRRLLK